MTETAPTPRDGDDEATEVVDDEATEVVDDEATEVVDDEATSSNSPGVGLQAATATIEEAEGLLGDVERALERLEAGQYLTCEICGAPLDPATLAGAPTLRRCVTHTA